MSKWCFVNFIKCCIMKGHHKSVAHIAGKTNLWGLCAVLQHVKFILRDANVSQCYSQLDCHTLEYSSEAIFLRNQPLNTKASISRHGKSPCLLLYDAQLVQGKAPIIWISYFLILLKTHKCVKHVVFIQWMV